MKPTLLIAVSVTAISVLASLGASQSRVPTLPGPPVTLEKNLRRVDRKDLESRLSRELHALVAADHSAPVSIVRCTILTDKMQDSAYKLLYSRQHRMLLLMIRTRHGDHKNGYHARVYDQVDPDDFRIRLPRRGQKGWPRIQQSFDKDKVIVPKLFAKSPDVLTWP